MSASQAIKHAHAVRARLRNPRNAVPDHGIDLKRKPAPPAPPPSPPPPVPVELPFSIGTPLPSYVLTYALSPSALPALSIKTIQRAVCEYYGVSLVDLVSSRRTQAVVLARSVAVWLSRRLTPHSLPAIGQHFRRDHTTMLHAARRIDELRQSDPEMQVRLDAFIAALQPAGA